MNPHSPAGQTVSPDSQSRPATPDRAALPATLSTDASAQNLRRGDSAPDPRQGDPGYGCTGAQLRRFITSRPYVPMHELRRRFELNGAADDVCPIDTPNGTVYLGLPDRESQLIAELVRQGDVALELCRDPRVPIAVGVYPIRPISRQ
jgi:hypothetical protein